MAEKDNFDFDFDVLDFLNRPSSSTPSFERESGRPAPVPVSASATYLAPGCEMEGNLKTKGDVEIAGDFKGDIVSEGKVTLHCSINGNITAAELSLQDCALIGDARVSGMMHMSENSSVRGGIWAGSLRCAGRVQGDVEVQSSLALLSSGQITGNITTGTLSVMEGAVIAGAIRMGVK